MRYLEHYLNIGIHGVYDFAENMANLNQPLTIEQ